jgi:hypothetical protein
MTEKGVIGLMQAGDVGWNARRANRHALMVRRTLFTAWSWKKAKDGRSCRQIGHRCEWSNDRLRHFKQNDWSDQRHDANAGAHRRSVERRETQRVYVMSPNPTYMLTRRGDRLVEEHRADITLDQTHQLLFERERDGRDRVMREATLRTSSENVATSLRSISGSRDGYRSEERQVLR